VPTITRRQQSLGSLPLTRIKSLYRTAINASMAPALLLWTPAESRSLISIWSCHLSSILSS